jgi:peptidoglycan hydrolase-like protein with peptidoglycan-binding domain
MGEETSRIFPTAIFPVAIFCALLFSGCPKTQETPSPAAEATKQPAEIARPEPAAPPSVAAPPPPAAPRPTETPKPQAQEPSQQRMLSGEALLDPAVPQDAKLIQGRLAELGLYRGAIDGVWGRNSRAALRAFKEKNALADPDVWDRDTQMFLFRETGK